MPADLKQAYHHCGEVARTHARNFYYAFRTLPSAKRRAIYAAYAFCRYCDDIADEDLPQGEKEARLTETRQLLVSAAGGDARGPVFTALHHAAQTFHIPQHYLEEVVEGVEMDLTRSRYRTFEELRGYCYKVASVVGLICIEVFGYQDPKAKEYTVDLGLAMQLTNIMRDVKEDSLRGRIYLPQEEIQRFGYSEEELMRGVVNEAFRNLMRHQASRARSYFGSGRRLIPLVSREARACPAVLHTLYSRVLDRIEASGFQVFERRIGLSTPEKLLIMSRLWALSLAPRPRLLWR